MNVALYCRVSTEEQAKFGLSIDAQLNELREYAKKNKYVVVGEYLDEGVSGGKLSRPALTKLLNDIPNKKIEMILFVKLDRWFRNVAYYYKVQETLDKYNVAWKTTQEDYETETSSGKFKVNIMLSVSQQFKDATSERIKSVFKYKQNVSKTVLSGNKILGYDIVDKKYVVNEEEAKIVKSIFEKYLAVGCYREVAEWYRKTYNTTTVYETIRKYLTDTKYIGIYKKIDGTIIEDLIPPIIDRELFDSVQKRIAGNTRKIDKTPIRVHLFSSLLFCGKCGKKYVSKGVYKKGCKTYLIYSCRSHICEHTCSNNKIVSEIKFEKYLINNFISLVEKQEYEIKNTHKKQNKKSPTIKSKLDKLTDLYMNDLITRDKYETDYNRLNEEYKKELEKEKNIDNSTFDSDRLKELYDKDFYAMYTTLSREDKKEFWNRIIDKIIVNEDGTYNVIFL